MGEINQVNYILKDCVHIEREQYNKIVKNYAIVGFLLIVIAIFIAIHFITALNLIKENTALKQEVQEYQDEVVYYRHTYENERGE